MQVEKVLQMGFKLEAVLFINVFRKKSIRFWRNRWWYVYVIVAYYCDIWSLMHTSVMSYKYDSIDRSVKIIFHVGPLPRCAQIAYNPLF